jgi:Tol biopolymer transport system component
MDHWRYDMMGQTMLIRNADGDYAPAHRSLLEFFVAYKFAAELGILASDFIEVARSQSHLDSSAPPQDYVWSRYFRRQVDESGAIKLIPPLQEFIPEDMDKLAETVGKEPLSEAVLALLSNMLAPDKQPRQDRLLRMIEKTRNKSASQVGFIGGNLATLLVHCDPTVFKGRDLSSANLRKAAFMDADLSGSKLKGADLQQALFSNVVLEKADFRDADLTDAQFEEMGEIEAVDFNPEGTMLASGGDDGKLHIWDVRTGTKLFILSGHSGTVTHIHWSKHNQLIASASADGSIVVWSGLTGDIHTKLLEVFPNWAVGTSLSPDGKYLAGAGGVEGELKVWDLETKSLAWSYSFNPGTQTNKVFYSPDGKVLVATMWDRGRPFETADDMEQSPKEKPQIKNAIVVDSKGQYPWVITDSFFEGTWGAAFSLDNKRVFIGDFAGSIFVYDVETKTRVGMLQLTQESDKPFGNRVVTIRSSCGSNLLAACTGTSLAIWDALTLQKMIQLRFNLDSRDRLRSLLPDIQFNPAGSLLVGGFPDMSIRFWDARPFITRDGAPHIDLLEYTQPDLSMLNEDTDSWPQWWQQCRIAPPDGMLPNPDLGRCLRMIKNNRSYNGLLLTGAKGMDTKLVNRSLMSERTVEEWLIARGAVKPRRKRPSAKKSRKSNK